MPTNGVVVQELECYDIFIIKLESACTTMHACECNVALHYKIMQQVSPCSCVAVYTDRLAVTQIPPCWTLDPVPDI